jgi:hypothetical protein
LPAGPCVKGAVFIQVVEELQRLLEAGAVARADLGRWLRPEDLEVVAERPLASAWYPIDLYVRANLLLRDVAGGGRDEYLVEQGRRSARRLLAEGHYRQVRHTSQIVLAPAISPEERHRAFGLDLRMMGSLSGSILNFSRWSSRPDPEQPLRYRIDVAEAADYPEVLCWRTHGFVNELAVAHGSPDLWRWERPSKDSLVFRMKRDL